MHRHYLLKVKSDCVFSTHCNSSLAWMPDELSPAHNNLNREVRSGIAPMGRNFLLTKICEEIDRPIKLSGRALYDDGQMINRDVIHYVTKERGVEFVFNKHGCRWRAERWRFKSVLEDIDSTFILKEEQRNANKAFVDRKDVFAVLPKGFGKSLIYQLAPMTYYVALIGCRSIQLSEEVIFFLVRLKHAP